MLTPKQVQAARISVGIEDPLAAPSTMESGQLFGDDLANHYLSIAQGVQQQGGGSSYLQKWKDVPNKLFEGYKGAIDTVKEGVTAGADLMGKGGAQMSVALQPKQDYSVGRRIGDFAKGAGKVALGTLRAGFGGTLGAQAAIFNPVGALTDAVVPDTGNEYVDKGVEGLAQAYAGGGLNVKGLLTSVGMNEAFLAKQKWSESESGQKFREDHPDLAPIIDGVISLGLAALGDKVQRDVGAEQGQPGIMDTPVSQIPGRVGQNLLSGPRALMPYVQGAANAVGEGVDKITSRFRRDDFEHANIPKPKYQMDVKVGTPEWVASQGLPEEIKFFIENTDQNLDQLSDKARHFVELAREAKLKPTETMVRPSEVSMTEHIAESLDILKEGMNDAGARIGESMGFAKDEVVPQAPVHVSDFETAVEQRFGGLFEAITDDDGAPVLDDHGHATFKVVNAPGRAFKLTSSDAKSLAEGYANLIEWQKHPTAQLGADIVDRLQSEVNYAQRTAAPLNDQVEGLFNKTQHNINASIKPLVDSYGDGEAYARANADYGDAARLYGELSRRAGYESGNSASIAKRIVLSPSDAGLRALIAKVEDYTGLPISEDALLANYIEKAYGDTRAESLLSQGREAIESIKHPTEIPGKIIGAIGDKITGAVTDPEAMLQDFINARRGAPLRPTGPTGGEGGGYSKGNISDDAARIAGLTDGGEGGKVGSMKPAVRINAASDNEFELIDNATDELIETFDSHRAAKAAALEYGSVEDANGNFFDEDGKVVPGLKTTARIVPIDQLGADFEGSARDKQYLLKEYTRTESRIAALEGMESPTSADRMELTNLREDLGLIKSELSNDYKGMRHNPRATVEANQQKLDDLAKEDFASANTYQKALTRAIDSDSGTAKEGNVWVRHEDGKLSFGYHNTDIVSYDPETGIATIDRGGWDTPSTNRNVSSALQALDEYTGGDFKIAGEGAGKWAGAYNEARSNAGMYAEEVRSIPVKEVGDMIERYGDRLLSNADPNELSDYMTNGSEEGAAALQEKGKMTVYRVVPKGKSIGAGDWVFDSKSAAQDFLDEYGESRGLSSIVSKRVPLDHLMLPTGIDVADPDIVMSGNGGEFLYVGPKQVTKAVFVGPNGEGGFTARNLNTDETRDFATEKEAVAWGKKVTARGDFMEGPPSAQELPEGPMEVHPEHLQNVLDKINSGGVSFDPRKAQDLGGTENTSVSVYPERTLIVDKLDMKTMIQYMKDNADLLSKPGHILGGWYDKSSGKIYLDVSAALGDQEAAVQLGQKYNQKAVFDLKNFKEIDTGGTGEDIPNMPSVEERAAEIEAIARKSGDFSIANDQEGQELSNAPTYINNDEDVKKLVKSVLSRHMEGVGKIHILDFASEEGARAARKVGADPKQFAGANAFFDRDMGDIYMDEGIQSEEFYHELGHNAVKKMDPVSKKAFLHDLKEGKIVPPSGLSIYEAEPLSTHTKVGELIGGLFRVAYKHIHSQPDSNNTALRTLRRYGFWSLVPPVVFGSGGGLTKPKKRSK